MSEDLFSLLLQVAGRLPDDVVAAARTRLAQGRENEAANAVASAFAAGGWPLRKWQCRILIRAGVCPGILYGAVGHAESRGLRYDFSPLGQRDSLDDAAVQAVRNESSVNRLCRAWRSGPALPGARVYLAELAGGDPIPLTHRIQHALTTAGERPPRVEVFTAGTMLPSYQRLALAQSDVLLDRSTACPVAA